MASLRLAATMVIFVCLFCCAGCKKTQTSVQHNVVVAAPAAPASKLLPAASQDSAKATDAKVAADAGCGPIDSPFDEYPCVRLSFHSEVSAGQTFERKFGGGLVFRLNPQGALAGWTIEVAPEVQMSPGRSEYVWVVNEPYRSYNVRDLDTSYGTSAKDAVAYGPREFNFVLNEQQFRRAADLTEILLMSRPQNDKRSNEEIDKEWNDALEAKGFLQVGKGRLTILDSRITESKSGPGSIDWLKFKVELHVPCGFAADYPGELAVTKPACAAPSAGKGDRIRRISLMKFIETHIGELNSDLADLETDCGEGQKRIRSLAPYQYGDLDGDGQEEAAVEGWSCLSGNGGADFFGVIKLLPDGKLVVLPVEPMPKTFKGRKPYEGLRGHMSLEVKNGRLVQVFPVYANEEECNACSSGGEREFVYRWDGHQFVLDDIINVPQEKSGN